MQTVTLAALKGSQAKSSSTVHLAIAMARTGVRVLVVDMDHQGAATNMLTDLAPPPRGVAGVLMHKVPVDEVVVPTSWSVDLLGASVDLASAELALAARIGREAVLRAALRAATTSRWDVCLIDTPPSIGLMSVNALVAADAVLTPVVPAFLSLLALRQFDDAVATVREALNPTLRPLGYMLCAVDGREGIAGEARSALREHAGELLWHQEIRTDVRMKGRLGSDTFEGRATKDYQKAAIELLKLLGIESKKPPSKPASKQSSKRALGRTTEQVSK